MPLAGPARLAAVPPLGAEPAAAAAAEGEGHFALDGETVAIAVPIGWGAKLASPGGPPADFGTVQCWGANYRLVFPGIARA